jgi:hypothetical protein
MKMKERNKVKEWKPLSITSDLLFMAAAKTAAILFSTKSSIVNTKSDYIIILTISQTSILLFVPSNNCCVQISSIPDDSCKAGSLLWVYAPATEVQPLYPPRGKKTDQNGFFRLGVCIICHRIFCIEQAFLAGMYPFIFHTVTLHKHCK